MFEKNTKKCFLAPFWPLFWPKLVKMTKKFFFFDSDAKPFPTRGHMPIFEQNYDNWYFRSQNGLSGPKKARKFWKTLKSSLGSWESLETIRICIIRQIRSAKVDIFTKTISPPWDYLIRTNFRADKFSRIFAQSLYLSEIARKLKLVPNIWSFEASVRKFIQAKIFELGIEKITIKTLFYHRF